MLVLTRKQQEKIRIGEHITITVLRTKGKTVRLGIEAPNSIPVIRGELTFAAPSGEAQVETAVVIEAVRTTVPVVRKSSDWAPNSGPGSTTSRLPGTTEPQVSFERVPREKLAETLPGMAASDGPLRAMLKRRTLSA